MASQVSILYPVVALLLKIKSLVWKSTEPQNNSQCGFIRVAHVEVRQFSDLLILISMRAIFDQVTCF